MGHEHLRHEASPRNRRKALHHAKCGREEVNSIRDQLSKIDDKCRYALGRLDRIINRLTTELEHDERLKGQALNVVLPPVAENSERIIQREHAKLHGEALKNGI
jgi:hypothetical protein